MADIDMGAVGEAEVGGPSAFSVLFNWTGAILSVALIGGLAVWAYQLAMRDVSGVPVIRALEGPMRIAPDDPGGERAAHQGLAVNSVAAEGSAAAPADRLVLAPKPVDLTSEDLPRPILAATGGEAVKPLARPEREQLTALADELSQGVEPLAAVVTPSVPSSREITIISTDIKGVAISPMPSPRPAVAGGVDAMAESIASSVALAVASPTTDVSPAELTPGTRLVQFGAFDTPDAARAAWVKLDGRFPVFMEGKKRVVQEAQSGGKTFWRLRAMGFSDLSDARRFCSALMAERQACIPVVVR